VRADRVAEEDIGDESHLRALAYGDPDAFAALFERYADFVYNVAFRRTASWSVAEDLTETVFLELWRQRDRVVTQAGSLRPWLAGVVSNQVKRHWRGLARQSRAVERLAVVRSLDGGVDQTASVDSRIDDERRMATLLDELDALPPAQREVLILWAWEGFSYEEIATALDLPIGTVRSRLSRARARLDGVEGTSAPSRESTAAEQGGVAG
jgi:RNA polymerase sigma factor (sigma-70 family)